MKGLATVLGIVMLGVAAGPAAGQAVRVEVGVNSPPVSAHLIFGQPTFAWFGYGDRGVWRTNPYLTRLYWQHMRWLARERARFAHMRRGDWRYRQYVRAYERERFERERALTREYQRWFRGRDRGWHQYADRDWNRERDRARGRDWNQGRNRERDSRRGGRH